MKDLLDVRSGEKTLFIFETTNQKNKPKKPTHITLDMCSEGDTPVSPEHVGHAKKSIWWMPWH